MYGSLTESPIPAGTKYAEPDTLMWARPIYNDSKFQHEAGSGKSMNGDREAKDDGEDGTEPEESDCGDAYPVADEEDEVTAEIYLFSTPLNFNNKLVFHLLTLPLYLSVNSSNVSPDVAWSALVQEWYLIYGWDFLQRCGTGTKSSVSSVKSMKFFHLMKLWSVYISLINVWSLYICLRNGCS